MMRQWSYEGSTDQETFGDFITEMKDMIDEEPEGKSRTNIIMFDGASYHTAKRTQELIAKLGLKCLLNVPYSPELNPAEGFIKLHKALISGKLKNGR